MKTILLIGYDEHLCLSIAYALRKEPFRLLLLTHHPKSSVKYSRLVAKVYSYAGYGETVEAVRRVAEQEQIDLIIPYDEVEILTVSSLRNELERIAPVVPLTDPEMIRIAIDKSSLYRFLTSRGLDVMPRSNAPEGRQPDMQDARGLTFPVLLKPGRNSFGRGIMAFNDPESLEQHLAASDASGYSLQEYIQGSDVTCNIVARNGVVTLHTIQESPIKLPGNYSRNDDLTFKEDEEVLGIVSRIVAELEWEGVACFDLRRRASDGKIFLLEINGRFWGSLVSSLNVAGINFPAFVIRQALGMPDLHHQKVGGEQYSLDRALKLLRKEGLKAIKRTKYLSYLHDPWARLAKYF